MNASHTASSFTTIRTAGAIDAPDIGGLPRGIAALVAAVLVAASVAAWSRSDVPARPDAASFAAVSVSSTPQI